MSENLNLVVQFGALDKLSGALKNIAGFGKQGSKALGNLKREARDLDSQLAGVRAELAGATGNVTQLMNRERDLADQLARTNNRLEQQKTRLERIGSIQSSLGKIAGGAGTAGAVASATVTAPVVAFGAAAFTAAADAEELQSALEVTFGKNAPMVEAWAERTSKALNRSKWSLMEGAKTFGVFFDQGDPAKAAAMSQQFAVLAQDLGSLYNTDPSVALDKLRSGLTGESEPLRDFGIFLTEAAVKAQALKMGLVPLNGELTEQQKVMARANLIMEHSAKAQGDLVKTGGSAANQLVGAKEAWKDMLVVVGQQLLPALTPAITAFTSLIQSFANLSPTTRKWLVIIAGLAALFGPVMLVVAGIATGISAVIAIAPALGAAFAVMTGPVGLFIGIMAGLAVAVYANWDKIKAGFAAGVAAVTGAWATVKGAFSAGVAAVKSVMGQLPGWLASLGGMMMRGLLNAINPLVLAQRLVQIAKAGITAFKNFFGIKSPSRLFMAMGGHMTTGLAMGIDKSRRGPLRAMGRMAAGVAGAGALSLSGPALASAGGAGGAIPAAAAPVTINVYQQPGEDAQALAARIGKLIEDSQRTRRLSSYADDF